MVGAVVFVRASLTIGQRHDPFNHPLRLLLFSAPHAMFLSINKPIASHPKLVNLKWRNDDMAVANQRVKIMSIRYWEGTQRTRRRGKIDPHTHFNSTRPVWFLFALCGLRNFALLRPLACILIPLVQ